MAKVLAIDDDPQICLFYGEMLDELGHSYEIASNLQETKTHLKNSGFDLVLLDLELPDGNGLDLMPNIKQQDGAPEVIIITGTGDVRGAELAFKYGAWDYVKKPFLLSEVSLPVTRALQYRQEKQETTSIVPLVRPRIIGESDRIRECLEKLGTAAATDISVLLTGETGTGKELFAKAIHENSKRAGKPFIAVDCGALPETLLESIVFGHEKGAFTGADEKQTGLIVQANGGTLMLDEVGELPLPAQRAFLRTLQERVVRPLGSKKEIPVDFRLVAATNQDLNAMVKKNLFREDLLYRIRTLEIQLPPLRERKEDIEEIVIKKLHELSKWYNLETKAVSPEFIKILNSYDWPGNLRELINVLEYVLANAGNDPTLFPKHLPPEYRIIDLKFDAEKQSDSEIEGLAGTAFEDALPTLSTYRNTLEKNYLKKLINQSQGDRRTACKISGISRSRLYGLLKKHGLPSFTSS